MFPKDRSTGLVGRGPRTPRLAAEANPRPRPIDRSGVIVGLLSAFDAKLPPVIEYQSFSQDGLSASIIDAHRLLDVNHRCDRLWHEQVAIVLVPAPELSAALRLILENDYGMLNSRSEIAACKVLVTYIAKSLGGMFLALTSDKGAAAIWLGRVQGKFSCIGQLIRFLT